MKKILLIGSAFIGVIVGAGFASGQEVLQYFTSFGLMGIIGGIIATALFAYVGMTLVWVGSRMKTNSHKDVIYKISGRTIVGRFIGTVIDYILIFTLFGVGVVMLAGAGSNLAQQFGLPEIIGTILMTILVLVLGMMNVDKVVSVIGGITPFLILFIVIISIYSFISMDGSFSSLNSLANQQPTTLPNWFIAGVNYASFNTAVGASMALVMGGAEKDRKAAAIGGLVGGFVLGLLIILSHLAIFSKIEEVGSMDMPMLAIVNDISPLLGTMMAIVILAMIFNTALSMFYSFAARFTEVETSKFRIFYTITLIVGFAVSFVGFTDLVSLFYPTIGYMGLVLILGLIYAPIKLKREAKQQQVQEEMGKAMHD
ncbi:MULTISPECIES: YkvI family membrane protein [Virgibacillus]|uniref:YkvI family membrane protein n=1 Tax=Virgibacillus TaxID=84406 RepID=UPI000388655E|nr:MULTISPECIES: membrane protein [Virgibacillus]EQB38517.1 membrane protein [Virgibacillus sp. CM-4]MYL41220.1 hypothetical protein [Virgibacillus massiliensis]